MEVKYSGSVEEAISDLCFLCSSAQNDSAQVAGRQGSESSDMVTVKI